MFSKLNLKWLVGIFVVLLLLVIIVKIRESSTTAHNRNRNFTSQLANFDSASVTSILITPKTNAKAKIKAKDNQVRLFKDGTSWKVEGNGKKYNADINLVKSMIGQMLGLRATSIAANGKSKWKEFQLTDSTATHVKFMNGSKTVLNIYLGKFSYKRPAHYNPYMSQRGSMTSYVRVAGDNKVYGVPGFLAMSFNRQANDLRDRKLISGNRADWKKLSFKEGNRSFDLINQKGKWTIDGLPTDSAATAKYLTSIQRVYSSDFADASSLKSNEPDYSLDIVSNLKGASVQINAFKADTTNQYLLSSSLNEGTYFSGKKSKLMDKLFISKDKLMTSPKAMKPKKVMKTKKAK